MGPRIQTTFVVVTPGNPVEILSTNVRVRGRMLKDDSIGWVRIDGWVTMTTDHFDAMKRKNETMQEQINDLLRELGR